MSGSAAAMRSSDPMGRFGSPEHCGNPAVAWLALGQAWRPSTQREFQPGWARVEWDKAGLRYEAIFVARSPRNRARQLNEATWELGDVCEIFVQLDGHDDYLELHVTPENQRLQLHWTQASHDAFSAGTLPLAQAFVADSDWAVTHSTIESGHWRVVAYLPNRTLGLPSHGVGRVSFRTAVCRYDCESPNGLVLSSTAELQELSFHRLIEWNRLELPREQGCHGRGVIYEV